MTSHSLPVQKAIRDKLVAHSPLGAAVYDHVPQDAAFPYIQIGDDTAIDDGGKDFEGQEITCTIHTWSRYPGKKECKTIQGEIYTALHDATLTISSGVVVQIRCEFEQSFTDPDGETRHGVQRFRAIAHD